MDHRFSVDTVRRPAVTVVVTNYNYGAYVIDCMRSILEQTYAPIECIVVDDCSTDDSVSRIKSFVDSTENASLFQLVQISENAGQMNSFIEGFQRASGDFIVFVDADDYLFPDFIEVHITAHLNADYPSAVSASNEIIVNGKNEVLAGSIEKWNRQRKPTTRLSAHAPIRATRVEGWHSTWSFGNEVELRQPTQEIRYVAPDDNLLKEFIWSTSSGGMFRRGALALVLDESTRSIRISADFYLFQYCHILGGSLLIQTCHGFYRRHQANNFASSATIGRGTRTWRTADGFGRKELFRHIEDHLLAHFDTFTEIMGGPRLVAVLAAFVPARRAPEVFLAAKGRPALLVAYVGLLVLKTFRRAWLRLIQAWRFV